VARGETVTVNRRTKNADGAKVNVPVDMSVSATKGEIILREKRLPTGINQHVSLKDPLKSVNSKKPMTGPTASVTSKPMDTASISVKKTTGTGKVTAQKVKPSIKVKVK